MSDVCTRVARTRWKFLLFKETRYISLSRFPSQERDIFQSNIPKLSILKFCDTVTIVGNLRKYNVHYWNIHFSLFLHSLPFFFFVDYMYIAIIIS